MPQKKPEYSQLTSEDKRKVDTIVLAKLWEPILRAMKCTSDGNGERVRSQAVKELFRNRGEFMQKLATMREEVAQHDDYKNVKINNYVVDGIDSSDFEGNRVPTVVGQKNQFCLGIS